jgi:hypothetical protein
VISPVPAAGCSATAKSSSVRLWSPSGRAPQRLAVGRCLGGRGALLAGALLPVVVLPTWLGRRSAAAGDSPADWDATTRLDGRPGEVLSLPFGAYRAYPWNGGRTVLDPLSRYVDADVLVDDTLWVGRTEVAGETHAAGSAGAAARPGRHQGALVVVQRGWRHGWIRQLVRLREVYAGERPSRKSAVVGRPVASEADR